MDLEDLELLCMNCTSEVVVLHQIGCLKDVVRMPCTLNHFALGSRARGRFIVQTSASKCIKFEKRDWKDNNDFTHSS